MPTLNINIDDIYFAISNAEAEAGLPVWIGHLNRKTGRLVFVSENDGECDRYFGLAAFSYTEYGWLGVTWTLGMGCIVVVVAILQRVGLRRWK